MRCKFDPNGIQYDLIFNLIPIRPQINVPSHTQRLGILRFAAKPNTLTISSIMEFLSLEIVLDRTPPHAIHGNAKGCKVRELGIRVRLRIEVND